MLRRPPRLSGRAAIAALVVASVVSGPAWGATIDVTAADDTVVDDGVLSIREAVALAATQPGGDLIRVPAGRYTLSCTAGPIVYDSRGALEIEARGAVLVEGCPGAGVLDVAGGTADVTLGGADVAGAGGTGGAALIRAVGRLRLVDVVVRSSGGPGVACDACDYLEVMRSRVRASGGPGLRVTGVPGVQVVVAESDIADNAVRGRGGGLTVTAGTGDEARSSVVVARTSVTGNVADGPGAGGGGIATSGVDLRVEDSTVQANRAGDGEWAADGGGILMDGGAGDAGLVVSGTTLAANTASAGGGGVAVAGGGDSQVDTTWLDGNVAGRDGGGLSAVTVGGGATLSVISSTFSRNLAGADSGGGAIAVRGPGLVGVSASTLDGNGAGRGGGILATDGAGVAVQRSTLSDNRATTGADAAVGAAAALQLGQSLVVLPRGAPACATDGGGALVSAGYSLLADASCAAGPTDVVSGADPRLGPLAFGPEGQTPVRTPAADSPAAGLMPGDLCIDDEDQRGVPRPQGERCDAGAVEVVEARAG